MPEFHPAPADGGPWVPEATLIAVAVAHLAHLGPDGGFSDAPDDAGTLRVDLAHVFDELEEAAQHETIRRALTVWELRDRLPAAERRPDDWVRAEARRQQYWAAGTARADLRRQRRGIGLGPVSGGARRAWRRRLMTWAGPLVLETDEPVPGRHGFIPLALARLWVEQGDDPATGDGHDPS